MRAFLAVPVVGEGILGPLGALLSELRSIRGLKTVPSDQLHFTLKFFEDLQEAKLSAAKAASAKAASASSSFSLHLSGLGTFPPRGPSRVVWVGCGSGSDSLVSLASAVEREFVLGGFAPEARPFSPHLTLARVKDPRAARDAANFVAANSAFDAGRIDISGLVLYQSVLGPSGAAHTPIEKARLGS